MQTENLYFLLSPGPVYDLAKTVARNKHEVFEACRSYAKSIGATGFKQNFDGRPFAFTFDNEAPEGFKKQSADGSYSFKKKSRFAADVASMPELINQPYAIATLLTIPDSIEYSNKTSSGVSLMGNPFSGMGFMWLSLDGPFCMYIPDVQKYVEYYENKGYTVCDNTKNFVPKFEGCRQIFLEEWKVMVAEHECQEKLAEAGKL